MTHPRPRPPKPLSDRIQDAVQEVVEAIAELVRPEPELVPIPVRARRPGARR